MTEGRVIRKKEEQLLARLAQSKPFTQQSIGKQLLDEQLQERMTVARAKLKKGSYGEQLPPQAVTEGQTGAGKWMTLVMEDRQNAPATSLHGYLRLGAVPDPSAAGQGPEGDPQGEDLAGKITDFADDSLNRSIAEATGQEPGGALREAALPTEQTTAQLAQATSAKRASLVRLEQGVKSAEEFSELADDLTAKELAVLEAQQAVAESSAARADMMSAASREKQRQALRERAAGLEREAATRALAAKEQAELERTVAELEKLGPPTHCPGYLTQAIRQAESERLHTKGGWREHTEGNRITTTRGDKIEVVYGNYRFMSLGHQEQNAGWDLSGGHVSQSGGGNTAGKGAGRGAQGGGTRRGESGGSGASGGGDVNRGGRNRDASAEVAQSGAGGAGDSGMSWVQNWGGNWRTVSTSTKGDTDTTTAGDSITRNYGKYSLNISGCERPWERHLLELNDGATDEESSPPQGALTPDELTKVRLEVASGDHILMWLATGGGKNTNPVVTEQQAVALRRKSEQLQLAQDLRQQGVGNDENFWVASGGMTPAQVPSFKEWTERFLRKLVGPEPYQQVPDWQQERDYLRARKELSDALVSSGMLEQSAGSQLEAILDDWFGAWRGTLVRTPWSAQVTLDSDAGKMLSKRVGDLISTHRVYAQWNAYTDRYRARFGLSSADPGAVWSGQSYEQQVQSCGEEAVDALQTLVDTGRISKADARAAAKRKNVVSEDKTWATRVESYTGSPSRQIVPALPPAWLSKLFPAMEPLTADKLPRWLSGPLGGLSPRQLRKIPPWTADPFVHVQRLGADIMANKVTTQVEERSPVVAGDHEVPQTPPSSAPDRVRKLPELPPQAQAAPPMRGPWKGESKLLNIDLPEPATLFEDADMVEKSYFMISGQSPRTYPWEPPAHDGSAVPLMKNHSWVDKSVSKTFVGKGIVQQVDASEPSVLSGESYSLTKATSMLSKTTIDEIQEDTTTCSGRVSSITHVGKMHSLTVLSGSANSTTIANTSSQTVGQTTSLTLGASTSTTLAATSSVTIGNTDSMSLAASLSITMGSLSTMTLAYTASSTLGVSADISMGPTIEVVVGPKKKLGIGSLTMAALRKIG